MPDCADVVSLLCLRNAKEGGHSSWSSSITVYNEILKRRPDLAHLLAGPWFFDRKGEVPEGKQGFFEIPVFNFHVCPAACVCKDVNVSACSAASLPFSMLLKWNARMKGPLMDIAVSLITRKD